MSWDAYLLFDGGCTVCSGLAEKVEQASSHRLQARSLREEGIQEILNQASPDWGWEPMLLEKASEGWSVHTGMRMRTRLAAKLGPTRALSVARTVRQAGVPVFGKVAPAAATSRRGFLQRTATVGTGAAAATLATAHTAHADTAAPTDGAPAAADWRARMKGAKMTELRGRGLEKETRQLQRSSDVSEMLDSHYGADKGRAALRDLMETAAVVHKLPDGNRVTAVGGAINEKLVTVSYQMERPIGAIRSESMLLELHPEKESMRLLAQYVNGVPPRPVSAEDQRKMAAGRSSEVKACDQGCTCYGTIQCTRCTDWNWVCIGRCCVWCATPNPWKLAVCVALQCPGCAGAKCCQGRWDRGCCDCGASNC